MPLSIGGAGGNIGAGQAARAQPDGYTIFVASPSYVANPTLFETVTYDGQKSFDAVTLAATAPTVLSVHPSVQARSVKDLVALIKASPAKLATLRREQAHPPSVGRTLSAFA